MMSDPYLGGVDQGEEEAGNVLLRDTSERLHKQHPELGRCGASGSPAAPRRCSLSSRAPPR
ncbi:hypothetical protein NKG94_51800 [Micromonospora sp. M12]